MLLGSRLKPQSMQRIISTMTRTPDLAAAKVLRQNFISVSRNFGPVQQAVAKQGVKFAPSGVLTSQAVRPYGTRAWWNVGKGKFMFVTWFIGFPIWAAVVQDYFGPYWFFHS
mmetsp:Transcript_90751/g.141617  ORF Transcript_90751/g.141617 Transcript_90751/m.141617 type:complete len:112 (+) Transcript_90751:52-387(+)